MSKAILIVLLVLMTIALCGTGGYAWWITKNHQVNPPTTSVKPIQPLARPVFMPLDTFTVNLQNNDNDPSRVLYIGLTLRLPDEKHRETLSEYLPELRSRLLLLLSSQKTEDLSNDAGKQRLVQEIKKTLSPPFVKGQPNQVINDVLFTAFILR